VDVLVEVWQATERDPEHGDRACHDQIDLAHGKQVVDHPHYHHGQDGHGQGVDDSTGDGGCDEDGTKTAFCQAKSGLIWLKLGN